MFSSINDITTIQLDHTSRCTLHCPQCARFHNSNTKINPLLPITDNTINDYKILLEPFNPAELKIFHCGNFGDSLASPTFDETFDYCIQQNIQQFKISTHGSIRSTDWWKDFASRGGKHLQVTFSIDGLQDTNHIYRIGADFDKIIANATAFIDAGGHANWYFIEFEHNYHQIEQAKKLAKDLGFKVFNVKYTGRFAEQQVTKISTTNGVIADRKTNQNQLDINNIKSTFDSFTKYVNDTHITCKYIQEKAVFVDMCMRLWPCTWLGAPAYFDKNNIQRKSFQSLYNMYGEDFNDMRKYGWDVLNHEFFKTYLPNSWNNPTEEYPRIYTCGRTCGDTFEYSSGYGKNTIKEKLST